MVIAAEPTHSEVFDSISAEALTSLTRQTFCVFVPEKIYRGTEHKYTQQEGRYRYWDVCVSETSGAFSQSLRLCFLLST